MTPGHQACLPSEVEFDVEEKIAWYLEISHWEVLFVVKNAECNPDVFHFLLDGSLPIVVPIFFIKTPRLCSSIWNFDSVLVVLANEAGAYCQDDAITLLQRVIDPP